MKEFILVWLGISLISTAIIWTLLRAAKKRDDDATNRLR